MSSASLVPSLEISTLGPFTFSHLPHSFNNYLLKTLCSRQWFRRKYKYEKSLSSRSFQYRVANKKSVLTNQNPYNIICLRIQSLLLCRLINLNNRLFPLISLSPFSHILAQHLETASTLTNPKDEIILYINLKRGEEITQWGLDAPMPPNLLGPQSPPRIPSNVCILSLGTLSTGTTHCPPQMAHSATLLPLCW